MPLISNDVIEIHTTDLDPAVLIPGVTQLSSELNTNLVTPQTGQAYDRVQSILTQAPQVPFQTEALRSMLGVVSSLTGKCIDSDGTHPGVTAYGQGA